MSRGVAITYLKVPLEYPENEIVSMYYICAMIDQAALETESKISPQLDENGKISNKLLTTKGKVLKFSSFYPLKWQPPPPLPLSPFLKHTAHIHTRPFVRVNKHLCTLMKY